MKFQPKGPAVRLIVIGVVITIAIIGLSMRGREIRSITRPPPVSADSAATQQLQLEPYAADGLASALIKTVFITLVILAIIVLGAKGLRQYWGQRSTSTSTLDMQILGRRYFNTKQSIALVRVRDKELLLGITDHSIRLLCDLTVDKSIEVVDQVIDLPGEPAE
jgi:flagellar biogenesis protein FliO